jgi:hypothetical protein
LQPRRRFVVAVPFFVDQDVREFVSDRYTGSFELHMGRDSNDWLGFDKLKEAAGHVPQTRATIGK